tara:strand:+ start:170 stop:346 length:177 start_codon:yes stop_codon:yes gene_type:complete
MDSFTTAFLVAFIFSILVVGFPHFLEKKIKTKYLRPEISVVEFIGVISISMLILGMVF